MTKAHAVVRCLLDSDGSHRQAARDYLQQVDPDDAREAVRIEMERTRDYATARDAALDNLARNPDHYRKLTKLGLRDVHRRGPAPAPRPA